MLETRACAITGCPAACPSSHLMCVPHWRMVPIALRRAVSNAFGQWRRAIARAGRRRGGCTQDTFDTITRLREAQRMAIDAVMLKEAKRDESRQEGQNHLFG